MELKVYLEILKRHAQVIIFVTTLAVLVVTLIGWFIPPTYKAKSTVRIILDVGLDDFTFREDYTERLLNTYREVLLSSPFLEKAMARTATPKPGLTTGELLKKLTVDVVAKTELMNISVVDRDPVFARDMANTLAELLAEYPQNLYVGRGKSTRQVLEEQLASIQAQLDAERNLLVEMNKQNKTKTELDALDRQIRINEAAYTMLLDRYELVRLNETLRANSINILAPATIPVEASNNIGPTQIILGVVLGLFGGIALAFVLENLDTRIHSARQLEYLTNLPVLSSVPHGLIPPGTFEELDQTPAVQALKEAYRVLIPNMKIFGKRDTSLRSILITSPTGVEGKSLVSANLSQAIAEQGQQLFLVETDLRSPSLGKIFSLEEDCGLSDLLARSAVLNELVHPTQQPNLFLVMGGNKVTNPTTLLASSTMRRFLDFLDTRNQFIILDAPPVLGVADTSVLAPHVNGVVLVVGQETSTREQVFAALRQLQTARARMLGIIFVEKGQKGWGLG